MSALLKKVLVVDDDPVVGTSFNRVLSQNGYVVVTATNGHEALSKLQDGDYDCVFTDIRMPGMDGLELAERVHEKQSWTPVVIVTGYGTQANEERARAAGVTAFLRKPLSPEMIESSALAAMAHERMQRPMAAMPVGSVTTPTITRHEIARTIETVHAEVHGRESNLKKFALLLAAPMVSLAVVVLGPVVGLVALLGMSIKAMANKLSTDGMVRLAKFVALAAAVPVVSLAVVVLGPVVGLVTLLGMCVQAAARKFLPLKLRTFLKHAALFFAGPFVGLAYVLLMPVVGLGTLAWLAVRGNRKAEAPQ